MRKYLASLVSLTFPPSKLKNVVLKMLGIDVDLNSYIGFSFIKLEKGGCIKEGAKIGHLNYINIDYLKLEKNAYIQNLNRIQGPFLLVLKEKSAIGNMNTITRAKYPVSWGKSILKLGKNTKITSSHFIDVTRPVIFGSNSILAGRGSQIWTHGYVHKEIGPERFRIDGSVRIGNNVYIASSVVITQGVCINDAIIVGANVTVSKSLTEKGFYVNQPLRKIGFSYETWKEKYNFLKRKDNIEDIAVKKCQK